MRKLKSVRVAVPTARTPNVDAITQWLCDSAENSLLQRVFSPLSSCSRGSTCTSQSYGTACVKLCSTLAGLF